VGTRRAGVKGTRSEGGAVEGGGRGRWRGSGNPGAGFGIPKRVIMFKKVRGKESKKRFTGRRPEELFEWNFFGRKRQLAGKVWEGGGWEKGRRGAPLHDLDDGRGSDAQSIQENLGGKKDRNMEEGERGLAVLSEGHQET